MLLGAVVCCGGMGGPGVPYGFLQLTWITLQLLWQLELQALVEAWSASAL